MYFPGYIRKNMLYSVLINVFLMYLFKYYSMIKNGYVDSLKSRQESGVEISKILGIPPLSVVPVVTLMWYG